MMKRNVLHKYRRVWTWSIIQARSQVQAKNWGQIRETQHTDTHTHRIMYRLVPQVKIHAGVTFNLHLTSDCGKE